MTYTVRSEHPRLLLTDIDSVIAKIQAAPVVWQNAIKMAERAESEWKQNSDGELVPALPEPGSRMFCAAVIYRVGLVPGFEYAKSQEEYGQIAVTDLLNWPRLYGPNDQSLQSICPAALVYDWVHDLLTDGQRAVIANAIDEQIQPSIQGYNDWWRQQNGWTGNGMIAALAIHGDVPRDNVGMYYTDNWFLDQNGYTDKERGSKKFLWNYQWAKDWYTDCGFVEGHSYTSRLWQNWVAKAGWESATGDDSLKIGIFENHPRWTAYRDTILGDGRMLSTQCNSYTSDRWTIGQYQNIVCATGLADPEQAAAARWLLDQTRGYEGTCKGDSAAKGLLFGLLIGDPRVVGRSPVDLGWPLDFVAPLPGETHSRRSWALHDTHVSFGCYRVRDRARFLNDVMVRDKGQLLLGCRDRQVSHSHGEEWMRNHVLFYDGETLKYHNSTWDSTERGSFTQDGDWFVGECAKAYNTPDVQLVERKRRYDRTLNTVYVKDRIRCADSVTPRICWNTPLPPVVDGLAIHLRVGEAMATMTVIAAAEIRICGGKPPIDGLVKSWDRTTGMIGARQPDGSLATIHESEYGVFARGYDGNAVRPLKEYTGFVMSSEDDRLRIGGYSTVFITPVKVGDTYEVDYIIQIGQPEEEEAVLLEKIAQLELQLDAVRVEAEAIDQLNQQLQAENAQLRVSVDPLNAEVARLRDVITRAKKEETDTKAVLDEVE